MKKHGKKVLSVFLSVLMCLSVFALDWSGLVNIAQTANAVTANPVHDFYITMKYKSGSNNGNITAASISVTGKNKSGDGTGSHTFSSTNTSWKNSSSEVKVVESSSYGAYFPTTMSVSGTWNSSAVGNHNITVTITLYVYNENTSKYESAYSGDFYMERNGWLSSSTKTPISVNFSSAKPKATKIDSFSISDITVPAYGTTGTAASASQKATCLVRDQYGVEWYTAPTFSISGNPSQVTLSSSSETVTVTAKAPTASTTNPILGATNVTVTAKYTGLTSTTAQLTVYPTYKVTYNASTNGGTLVTTPATQTLVNNSTNKYLDWTIGDDWTAAKTNYAFRGWSQGTADNRDADSLYSAGKTFRTTNLNETVYAQFSKEVSVRTNYYNSLGNSVSASRYSYGTAWNKDTNVKIELPAIDDVTYGGTTYTGKGWAENSATTTTKYIAGSNNNTFAIPNSEGSNVNGDYNVYAVYTGSIGLNYDVNQGTITSGSLPTAGSQKVTKTFNVGEVGALNTIATNDVTATFTVNPNDAAFERELAEYFGYFATDPELDGDAIDETKDSDANAGYYKTGTEITLTKDTVLYAAYRYKPFAVRFFDYDGTLLSEQMVKLHYDAVPPVIMKNSHFDTVNHYSFSEWVGGKYTDIDKEENLYARYTAYGHIWEVSKTVKAATCTENGQVERVCSVCGYTEYVATEKTGHNWVVLPGTDPTCTEDGTYGRRVCTNCGIESDDQSLTLEDGTVVDMIKDAPKALGHDWSEEITVASTCVTHGYVYKECARCGVVETIEAELPLVDHERKTVTGIAPTCTTTGQSDYVICDVCGELLEAPKTLSKLGHTLTHYAAVTPDDCTADGTIEYWVCETCGKYFSSEAAKAADEIKAEDGKTIAEQLVKKALYTEHAFIEYTDDVAATCTAPGHTAGIACSRCGFVPEGSEAYTTEPALGHDFSVVLDRVETDKPCLEHSYTVYGCSRCDATETVYDEGDLADHVYDETEGVAPTCYAFGETGHKFCTVCGETFTEYELIPKLAHTFTTTVTEAVPATCTEEGAAAVYECAVCREAYEAGLIAENEIATTGGETVAPLGHDYTGWTVTAAVTCTEDGSRTRRCLRCELTETEILTKLGHNIVEVAAKEPTCTEEGNTAGEKCTRCDYHTYEILEKIPHTFGDWEVRQEATCAVPGVQVRECAVCGEVETKEIPQLSEHQGLKTLEAVPATCTSTGLTEGEYCTVCGLVTVAQEVTPITDHVRDDENVVNKAPTCLQDGVQGEIRCKDCGKVLVAGRTLPATGHSYADTYTVVSTLTCTTDGVRTRVCVNCGGNETSADKYGRPAVQTVTVKHQGHVIVVDERVEPTCTEPGLTEGSHCINCDEMTVAQEVIPAKGHSYDGEVVAATCTEGGYTVYTCTECGDTYRDNETAPLGHTGGAATCVDLAVCTRCGEEYGSYTDHKYVTESFDAGNCVTRSVTTYKCSVCGVTKTEEGDFGSHVYNENDVVVVAATCTEPGYASGACEICGEVIVVITEDALGHNYVDGTCTRCGQADPSATAASQICAKCGLNHTGRTGLWKQDGFFCKLISFFRNIFSIFQR